MNNRLPALVSVFALLLIKDRVTGTFPKAQGVSWDSVNFKTLLKWGPTPTNFSYTVEFSQRGQSKEKTPNCIQTSETECDLTTALKPLNAIYSADILSEPVQGATNDLIEFPHTTSRFFCPYNETNITRPEFEIKVDKDQDKTILYVKDVPTAVFNLKQRQTIRDIFKDDLKYKVYYWKSGSSGQKEMISKDSEIEFTRLDKGESYCFKIQAYIPSRPYSNQLGEISHVKCSPQDDKSLLEDYSILVIGGAILVFIAIISLIIAVIVVCCKRRQNAKRRGNEGVPLKGV